MTSVVKWDEFHALLFVRRRLLSGMTPSVPQSETCENKIYRVANGSNIKNLGGKIIMLKTMNGFTQSMNFRIAGVTRALASESKMICQRKQLCHTMTEATSRTKLL